MGSRTRIATTAPPSPTQTPSPPAPGATARFWRAISSLRGGRSLHPHGVAYEATLTVTGGDHGAPLLDVPGQHRAIVRLSRGVGLPKPLPDVLGLAVRIVDAHGPRRHQDFLVVTSVDAPLLHHLILPGPLGPYGQSYSSVLPYRVGGRLRLIGALPRRPDFDLAIAALSGRWEPFGRLRLGERLSAEASFALRFNVWNCGGGIRPTGPFQGLRDPAYRGSQAAR
ncbi:MAG TPA: hypothetical protein VHF89_01460 [Solirubrobacteraceae bacterium]|nr:hypothetical protein [Solirubrobacteraceae bacterium]